MLKVSIFLWKAESHFDFLLLNLERFKEFEDLRLFANCVHLDRGLEQCGKIGGRNHFVHRFACFKNPKNNIIQSFLAYSHTRLRVQKEIRLEKSTSKHQIILATTHLTKNSRTLWVTFWPRKIYLLSRWVQKFCCLKNKINFLVRYWSWWEAVAISYHIHLLFNMPYFWLNFQIYRKTFIH